MCSIQIVEWFVNELLYNPSNFNGKRILEVGSRDVNGSVRPFVEMLACPKEYVGIDIENGKGVDLVLPVEQLVQHFGIESFDVVISTELLEHVKDWRTVVNNMKAVLKNHGLIFITTVAYGMPYHAYPQDFWRYELEDLQEIFSDFQILHVAKHEHNVFLKAVKSNQTRKNLENISLYSMAKGYKTLAGTCKISFKRKLQLAMRKFGGNQVI